MKRTVSRSILTEVCRLLDLDPDNTASVSISGKSVYVVGVDESGREHRDLWEVSE